MSRRPSLLRRAASAMGRWFNRLGTPAGGGMRSVFKGAEQSRFWMDWISRYSSPDQEMANDFAMLRGRARDLAKNNPLIRQYLGMLSANVIGPVGFTFQAQVRTKGDKLDQRSNDKIEAAWADWGTAVTVDGKMSLVDFQQHLIQNLATDGEILVRKVRSFRGSKYRYALQQLDPDLLDYQFNRAPGTDGPEIRMGVEVDEWGKPLGYWFWTRYPSDLINVADRARVRIPADEVVHLYRPDRANQTRGTSWLNSAMFPLKMSDGYVEAELIAARIGAAKMGFFEYDSPADFVPPDPKSKPPVMDASPGTFETLPPGLRFKEWNPEHPSNAFPAFIKAVTRWVASGLNVSYNGLANDLEGVNYSSMRSGVLMERDQWRTLQRFWVRAFLRPIFEEWLDFAQLSGTLVLDNRNPEAFKAAKFLPRGWQWVDPLKDVNAAIAGIDNGLTSRSRVIAEQGGDFEEILEELAAEQRLAEEYDVKISGVGETSSPTAGDVPEEGDGSEPADSSEGDAEGEEEDDAGAGSRTAAQVLLIGGRRP